MDPVSHRMIGVRADMTPQVARIAATRLAHAPRPLRLSYAGQVLRVRGSEMRPERQFGQVGAELIGAAGPAADVEVIAVPARRWPRSGVPHLSVDITLPTLVPAIAEAYGIARRARGRAARRARPQGRRGGGAARRRRSAASCSARCVAAAGPAERGAGRPRPPRSAGAGAAPSATGSAPCSTGSRRRCPELKVRSTRSRTAASSTTPASALRFSRGRSAARGPFGELGRGGRYQAGDPAAPEPATGFTLYTDTILRTLPQPPRAAGVLVPLGADRGCAGAPARGRAGSRSPALAPAARSGGPRRAASAAAMSSTADEPARRSRRGGAAMAQRRRRRRPVGRRGQGQDRRLAVASAPMSSCASRAATMPATRWSSAMSTYKLSLLPSGVVRPGKLSIIGNGVVVDPWALLAEIETMRGKGLTISPDNAAARRQRRADPAARTARSTARARSGAAQRKIGTTGRGIGPAYEDKVGRRAVRVCDLADPQALEDRVDDAAAAPQRAAARPRRAGIRPRRRCSTRCCADRAEGPALCRRRSGALLDEARRAGRRILFEGAQGAMLDVDHGTYPFVTSSNTVAGQAAAGSGIAPGGDRLRARHHQGLHDAGRRRPVPDRADRRDRPRRSASAAASSAP